jgi:16S rRNA (uracil1498-N3)-methyltransferase
VNFLLLAPDEVGDEGFVALHGARAAHVRTVLRASPGQELRAGLLGGRLGQATVLAVTADEVQLRCALPFVVPPPAGDDVLLLAVPRPKVLLRLYAHAAALGFARLVLFRSWRVEKSHLQSKALQPAAQRAMLLAGLEQAGRTTLPCVQFFPLFKPMVEDALAAMALPPARFVAHPAAPTPTHALAYPGRTPFALAIGPDGGFLPYEVDALAKHGFLPVRCGSAPLRTETALAVLAGQLALLRERATVAP